MGHEDQPALIHYQETAREVLGADAQGRERRRLGRELAPERADDNLIYRAHRDNFYSEEPRLDLTNAYTQSALRDIPRMGVPDTFGISTAAIDPPDGATQIDTEPPINFYGGSEVPPDDLSQPSRPVTPEADSTDPSSDDSDALEPVLPNPSTTEQPPATLSRREQRAQALQAELDQARAVNARIVRDALAERSRAERALEHSIDSAMAERDRAERALADQRAAAERHADQLAAMRSKQHFQSGLISELLEATAPRSDAAAIPLNSEASPASSGRTTSPPSLDDLPTSSSRSSSRASADATDDEPRMPGGGMPGGGMPSNASGGGMHRGMHRGMNAGGARASRSAGAYPARGSDSQERERATAMITEMNTIHNAALGSMHTSNRPSAAELAAERDAAINSGDDDGSWGASSDDEEPPPPTPRPAPNRRARRATADFTFHRAGCNDPSCGCTDATTGPPASAHAEGGGDADLRATLAAQSAQIAQLRSR